MDQIPATLPDGTNVYILAIDHLGAICIHPDGSVRRVDLADLRVLDANPSMGYLPPASPATAT